MSSNVSPLRRSDLPASPKSEPATVPPVAGSFSPLTEKCAFATRVAFDAGDAAMRALWACENALDEVASAMKRLEATREQLTATVKKLHGYQASLNLMNQAYLSRLTKKEPT